jgi:hypothetical protein
MSCSVEISQRASALFSRLLALRRRPQFPEQQGELTALRFGFAGRFSGCLVGEASWSFRSGHGSFHVLNCFVQLFGALNLFGFFGLRNRTDSIAHEVTVAGFAAFTREAIWPLSDSARAFEESLPRAPRLAAAVSAAFFGFNTLSDRSIVIASICERRLPFDASMGPRSLKSSFAPKNEAWNQWRLTGSCQLR